MKKFLIAAAGLSAIAAAAPAAAQYYPNQPAPYGGRYYNYDQQYNQSYGYAHQQRLIQSYVSRADQLRRRVERFDSRDRISEREASRLRNAAIDLQNRTRAYARNGINPREQRELDERFAQLHQRIAMEARDGSNRYGNGYGRGVGGGRDRDWDGVRDNRDVFIDANRNGIDDRREGYGYIDRRDDRYEDDRGRYPG
jgi:opacity protein-like surface antigen